MPEIFSPVDLCDHRGNLSQAAIGWSRRPLHRCNLRDRWRKRWNWWCVTDERWFLMLCVADLDYLALGTVSLLDLSTGERCERLVPLGCEFPEMVSEVHFDRLGMKMDLGPDRLFANAGPIRADIRLGEAGDSLSVVVPGPKPSAGPDFRWSPWQARRFWYTSKHVGIPARGEIRWGHRSIDIDGWAALDFGRGRWPARARWNWGVAVGKGLSFNLGGRWTDGSGATENGLFVDGKLLKIESEIQWRDWKLRSPEVELDFEPVFERRLGWPPRFGLHWCTGRYSGRVLDHRIDHMFGWAEALDILW